MLVKLTPLLLIKSLLLYIISSSICQVDVRGKMDGVIVVSPESAIYLAVVLFFVLLVQLCTWTYRYKINGHCGTIACVEILNTPYV